jgi:hypothetical protein
VRRRSSRQQAGNIKKLGVQTGAWFTKHCGI